MLFVSRKKHKNKTAFLSMSIFPFTQLNLNLSNDWNSNHWLFILFAIIISLAAIYTFFIIKKIYQTSPKVFPYLAITATLAFSAWGIDKALQEDVNLDVSRYPINSSRILGEIDDSDQNPADQAAQLILDQNNENLKKLFAKHNLELDVNGNLWGDINLRGGKLKLKTGSVNGQTIKDGSIQNKDIADNIDLQVKQLIAKDEIKVGGEATFENGINITSGSLSATDITADTFNGNVISTGTGTLTLDTYALTLSGDTQINQNLLTTSSPIFAGLSLTGNLDMQNNLIQNIGNVGTDFTATGGLNLAGSLNVNDQFFVDTSNGNVGIGTTSPVRALQINTTGSTSSVLKLTQETMGTTDSDGFSVATDSAGNAYVINYENTPLYFQTNVQNRMTILGDGNVGIGTTTPSRNLQIVDLSSNAQLEIDASSGYNAEVILQETGANKWYFSNLNSNNRLSFRDNNANERLVIEQGGSVGIGRTSPETTLDVNGSIHVGDYSARTVWIQNGTSAASPSYTFRARTSTGFFMPSDNELGFSISSSEKVRIDSSGNVGIGTTSPNAKLEVIETNAGDKSTPLVLSNKDNTIGTETALGFTSYDGTSTTGEISNIRTASGKYALTLSTYDSSLFEAMRINSAGNVGIGTTTPATKLDVVGSIASSGTIFAEQVTLGYVGNASITTYNTNEDLSIGANGTGDVLIQSGASDGNVGIGTTGPGEKLTVLGNISVRESDDGFEAANISGAATRGQILLRESGTLKVLLDGGSASYFNAGNVGIGTTSPINVLDVVNDGNQNVLGLANFADTSYHDSQVLLMRARGSQASPSVIQNGDELGSFRFTGYNTGTSGSGFGNHYFDAAHISAEVDGAVGGTTVIPGMLLFKTAAGSSYNDISTKMVIRGSGNVGIGTSSPEDTLEILPTAAGKGFSVRTSGDDYDAVSFEGYATSGVLKLNEAGDLKVKIQSDGINYINSGNVGIGTTNPGRTLFVNGDAGGTTGWYNDSDLRLKKNITTMEDSLAKILNLRPINFEWKDSERPEGNHIGFIAQEVLDVVPEVVSRGGEYYGVDYASLAPALVGAIQEQQLSIQGIYTQVEGNDNLITQLADKSISLEDKLSLISSSLTSQSENLTELENNLEDLTDLLNEQINELEDNLDQLNLNQETNLAKLTYLEELLGVNTAEAGDIEIVGKITAQSGEILGVFKAKEIETENLKMTGNETSGKAKIEAGEDSITIESDLVTEDSKIYITPLSKLEGRVLWIDPDEISEGESFLVKLEGEVSENDIEFNWMIIN